MTTTIYERYYPKPSLEDIRNLEAEFALSFPKAYVDFLLTYNGGHPEPNVFNVRTPQDDLGIIEWLFGIHTGLHNNLRTYLRWRVGRMPLEYIPIGIDPGGNMVCICITGAKRGEIYFWDHEGEAQEEQESTYNNLYYVSDGFTEFIDTLTEPDF